VELDLGMWEPTNTKTKGKTKGKVRRATLVIDMDKIARLITKAMLNASGRTTLAHKAFTIITKEE